MPLSSIVNGFHSRTEFRIAAPLRSDLLSHLEEEEEGRTSSEEDEGDHDPIF